jgi:hypothetical protein
VLLYCQGILRAGFKMPFLMFFYFFGAFARLLKANITFVVTACLHGKSWLPLDGFS